MRVLDLNIVTKAVKEALLTSCYNIDSMCFNCLQESIENENNELAKEILRQIIENDQIASNKKYPVCQDTGIVVCFLEVGREVYLPGDIYQAINKGVKQAYQEGYLRKSVVNHPLNRINTHDNTPAIIHTTIVDGDKVTLHLMPKGAGAENVSIVKMLIPADGIEGVKKLVIQTVIESSAKACPPIMIGLGIGGDLEECAILAKKALLIPINQENEDPILLKLEKELLIELNKLNIGPMGFGGKTTCLSVKALTYPCHIASLPVAINIQCHVNRHQTIIL